MGVNAELDHISSRGAALNDVFQTLNEEGGATAARVVSTALGRLLSIETEVHDLGKAGSWGKGHLSTIRKGSLCSSDRLVGKTSYRSLGRGAVYLERAICFMRVNICRTRPARCIFKEEIFEEIQFALLTDYARQCFDAGVVTFSARNRHTIGPTAKFIAKDICEGMLR